jgi:hypothetical protein
VHAYPEVHRYAPGPARVEHHELIQRVAPGSAKLLAPATLTRKNTTTRPNRARALVLAPQFNSVAIVESQARLGEQQNATDAFAAFEGGVRLSGFG